MNKICLFNTYVDASAGKKVQRVLDSTFLSEGKLVKDFESQLSKQLGLQNPAAVNSGTSALHLAVILSGVRPEDEVICPAQTFVASAMVVLQERAKPVFADIQYETGNIEPKSIEKKITKRTKAIMVVHWGGYPVDLDEIHTIAKKYNIAVIEDAAHALGATYHGQVIGGISDFTCFSFQAIKHLTTGDGGAVCVKNSELHREALNGRWFGIDRKHSPPSLLGERVYNLQKIGYKYHMNDYAAALGLANLEGFKKRLDRRKVIAKRYRSALKSVDGINLFHETEDRQSAYWLFGFHVKKREEFIKLLKSHDIECSVVHLGIDHNDVFGGIQEDLANQRKFDQTQIHIPIHDALTDEQVDYIITTIKKGW